MDHPVQTDFLRWIVLFPLLGAAVNGLLGARIQERAGKRMVAVIACAPVTLSFLFSLWAFSRLLSLPAKERFLIDHFYSWIPMGSFNVDVAFWVDPLSAIMILVVSGIGGLIHFYSIGYMHEDRSLWRYFAYLNLFTFSMLLLVTGDNLLLMFVGWEGVGLCSWALIGFWYTDHTNTRAGNKAFIVNRVGDFGFVLGIFLLFWSLTEHGQGTLAFREIQEHVGLLANMEIWGIGVVTAVTILLFIGATGKSAQIPLFVWLPDAMQGPTPVSALIHAATMVTAGVYMIARLNPLFSAAPVTLGIIAVVGAATAFFAATVAVTQTDIKRVLAYSTISQLGYMFLAMGVAAYSAGIFHLLTHAFFKACLFLGSGSIIHAMQGEQDMRKMGGLRKVMPATFWTFTIAVLAIAGAPFLAGFFSKDAILWQAWATHNQLLWGVAVFVAGLTAFYMFRQFFMVFFGECRADHHVQEHLHESPKIMTYPLWILAAGSVVVGYIGAAGVHGRQHARPLARSGDPRPPRRAPRDDGRGRGHERGHRRRRRGRGAGVVPVLRPDPIPGRVAGGPGIRIPPALQQVLRGRGLPVRFRRRHPVAGADRSGVRSLHHRYHRGRNGQAHHHHRLVQRPVRPVRR